MFAQLLSCTRDYDDMATQQEYSKALNSKQLSRLSVFESCRLGWVHAVAVVAVGVVDRRLVEEGGRLLVVLGLGTAAAHVWESGGDY